MIILHVVMFEVKHDKLMPFINMKYSVNKQMDLSQPVCYGLSVC